MRRLARTDGPGCAVGVVQKGQVVFQKGYGMADLEHGVPITADTLFDVASNGKQFTSLAIHLLVRDGAIRLDDDIRTYVPELSSYGAAITLRHLLLHTSGLRDYTHLLTLAGHGMDDSVETREMLEMILRQQNVEFAPGAAFSYSNSGYFLLGLVIERVSKQSYDAFLADRILKPLGMTRSRVNSDPKAIVPGRAIGYAKTVNGEFRTNVSPWPAAGDGGLLTNVAELARWDQNFYEPKVGDRAVLEQMQAPGTLNDGSRTEFASGLVIGSYRGQPTVQHGGGWPGFGSQILRFPAQHTTVIALCNAPDADSGQVAQRIADVVLERSLESQAAEAAAKAPPRSAAPLEPGLLAAWAGTYELDSGDLLDVHHAAGGLVIQRRGGAVHDLVSLDAQHFLLAVAPEVRLHFEGSPPNRTLTDSKYGTWRERVPRVVPAAELAAYVGRYRCDELGVTWRVRVEGGRLVLLGRNVRGALEPLRRPGAFVTGKDAHTTTEIEFERSGLQVTALTLGGEEPKLRFIRER